MTHGSFISLNRGDIVRIGKRFAVVEASYYQAGKWRVDLQLCNGELVNGVAEDNRDVLDKIVLDKPEETCYHGDISSGTAEENT